jgi:DNA-binding transcriptional LysR family regulator
MEPLSLRRLQHLVTVVECRSISAAATELSLSAAALSASLKELERSIGVTLLIRRAGEGVSPTPEGATLASRARDLLAEALAVRDEITLEVVGEASTVVVGSLTTVAPLVVPRIIARYRRLGAARVDIRTGAQDAMIEWLENGATHLAFTYDLGLPEAIRFEALASARPLVMLPASHRLAGRRHISLAQLIDEPYLQLDLPLSREYFFSLFLNEGIEPTNVVRLTDLELARSAVGNGMGWSLVNLRPPIGTASDGSQIAYVPLHTSHPPLSLGIATLLHRRQPTSVLRLIEAARVEHGAKQ